MPHYRRFQDASVSEKILDTLFLLTVGLGYLFAMGHLYFSHEGRDGESGLSVEDVRIAYYGEHAQTRLGAALNGSMAANLETPAQKETIFNWIESGANVDEFNAQVAPILNERCVMCHSDAAEMGLPPLTNFEEVSEMIKVDTGASVKSLVRVSHIHLFGIAFILFFVGRVFILCEMPVTVKRITVAIPFLAMLLDILSWYITKIIPGFAYVVVLSGALMGVSFAAQVLISLYQMWFYKPKVVPVDM